MLHYKERYASGQILLPALPGSSTAAAPPTPPTPDDIAQLWRFSDEQVFGQTLDGFLLQLTELRHVFEAAVQFQQLEKLEIGGLRGKLLTERIRQVSMKRHLSLSTPSPIYNSLSLDLQRIQASLRAMD